MGGKTVMIVPATVPSAVVQRLRRRELEPPTVLMADPYPVAPARPRPVVSDVLTPEQVAQLRAENAGLRAELERVRTS